MAHELTIELGDDFAPVDHPKRAREHDGRRRRWYAAILVVALVVLLSSGSAVWASPMAPKLATITANAGGAFMVTGAELVIADVRDGHNAMTAYALPSGRQLWSTKLTVLANDVALERIGNAVVGSFQGGDIAGDQTNAVDLRTGAMLWRSPGALVEAFPRAGAALVSTTLPSAGERFEMIDVATGRVRWARQIGAGCDTNLAGHFVVLCPDPSTMTVVDVGSGGVVAAGAVDLGSGNASGGLQDTIRLAEQDGVIVVGHLGDSGPLMDAYRASDLKHLWRMPFFDSAYIEPCGQIFCMSDGRISTGLDPLTGHTRSFPGFNAPPDDPYQGDGPVMRGDRVALIPGRSMGSEHSGGIVDQRPPGDYSDATAVASYPDSTAINVPSSTRVNTWLAKVDLKRGPPSKLVVTPVQQLTNIGVRSCALVDRYMACAVDPTHMVIYDVGKLTGSATR